MGLTNFKIKSAAIGKRHHDGRGLCLTLSAPGRGKWTMRYMINRKAKEIGLGRYPELSLADARKKHFEARILIAEGKDPLTERRKAEAQMKREALRSIEEKLGQKHPFRPIQDTRNTKPKNSYRFFFSHSIEAAKYLYQTRNNISHRGKAGYEEDIPIIDASLEILILTIQNLLNIENYSNHQSQ